VNAFRELFLRSVHTLTRPNPDERRRNIWFQVEAKAERSSNIIRTGYVLVWVVATLTHAPGNPFWSNVANLGCGGFWLAWCVLYQWYLLKRPYRKWFKYLSTTVDMTVITAMLFFYAHGSGYAYALKVPTFFNYFCVLGLAAMRYRLHLAVYGGVLAVTCYFAFCAYLYHTFQIEFGTGWEHGNTGKVSGAYIAFNFTYLVVFTGLIYFLVYNVKRLVNVRVREGEAALKAKERAAIAANVAHEIKNPLEGIYGAAQILKEEGKGNPKFIDMILKDSVRLNGVVHQFLQFSRPFRTQMSDFDLVDVVSAFSREQALVAGEDKVRFRCDCGILQVHADQEGLRQVMLNLYQNARRYQQAGFPVDIIVRAAGECAEVLIEDDGEGVAEANRERVFDPFFTTSSKGTGLGLAISRKIAREMGGDLYLEPKQPGARFVLSLKPGKTAETAP
jgi:signal transduction histidine kinase